MAALSLICGIATGQSGQVALAAVEGAQAAVELCISIAGMLCLWTGVMEVMNRSGLAGKLSRLLRPVDSCFAHLPALALTAAQAKRVRSGAAFTFPREGTWRVYSPEGEFLAVCRSADGQLRTVKSFFEV